MTVSSSGPSDASALSSPASVPLHRRIPVVVWLAALYLLSHLPFLAPSLEDYDSINFGLALHDYDIGKNQPHPPDIPPTLPLAAPRWPSYGCWYRESTPFERTRLPCPVSRQWQAQWRWLAPGGFLRC